MFKNYIKNKLEKLLNGADIYGLHFKCDCETIKDTPLLNILSEGVYLPVSVQKIVDCTGHITDGHKKDTQFVAVTLFDPMNDLDPEKKLVDLHIIDGASVCRRDRKKNLVFISYAVIYCWSRLHLP